MDVEKVVHGWADWALKAILVGVVTLSMNYLKSMSDHIQSVDITITELRADMKNVATTQAQFEKITDKLEKRIEKIEKNRR